MLQQRRQFRRVDQANSQVLLRVRIEDEELANDPNELVLAFFAGEVGTLLLVAGERCEFRTLRKHERVVRDWTLGNVKSRHEMWQALGACAEDFFVFVGERVLLVSQLFGEPNELPKVQRMERREHGVDALACLKKDDV